MLSVFIYIGIPFSLFQKKKKKTTKKKKHHDDEIKEALDESYDGYLTWPNS